MTAMKSREFHNLGELEELSNKLARATAHNVYVDTGGNVGDPPSNSFSAIDGKTGIWNERDDTFAYMAGKRYTISQHRDVIDHIRESVAGTNGEIRMGVVRDYGAVIDGTLVFDGESTIDVGEVVGDGYVPPDSSVDEYGTKAARDTLGLGMRFSNSFDGSSKVTASTMAYRYICQNWMVWGEEILGRSEQFHIEELTPEFFGELVADLFEVKDPLTGMVVDSAGDKYPVEWVPGMLSEAGFGRNYANRIAARAYEYEGETVSRWGIYNAITYELDHYTAEKSMPSVYNHYQDMAIEFLTDELKAPAEETEIDAIQEATALI